MSKPLGEGISGNLELNQFNEPISEMGIGIKSQVPKLPKGAYATVGLMPLYIDKNGKKVKNKGLLEYFGSLNLPKGFWVSSFGELDIVKGEWGYGEIELGKRFGPVRASYNPALIGNGDMIPGLEHRIAATVDF